MKLYPIIVAIPIYFLLMSFEWIMLKRKSMRTYRVNDTISNISCGIISQVTGVFLKILLVGCYTLVYENVRLMDVPIVWWTYVLLFLGFDLCYYWMHRFSHQVNLFWAGHVVHHQSQEYNFSVAIRQSSTQIIWTFFFYLPLALIGFDPVSFVTVAGLSLLYQFWIHTELIRKMPAWFEFLFNTPSHHRVHHAINDKYIDKNHSGILIIWDRMFGTYQEEEEEAIYGITKPLNSWNPVWANLSHYSSIARNARAFNSWKDKIILLFRKPGWVGLQTSKQNNIEKLTTKETKPFDVIISESLSQYVVAHFIALLLVACFFFLNQDDLNITWKLSFTTFIILSAVSFGVLLENRKWAMYLEVSRVSVLLIAGLIGVIFTDTLSVVYNISICAALVSFVLLWKIIEKSSHQ